MEAFVQMTGYVGGDVSLREAATAQVADFRLASTPRVQRNGEWEDGPTTWITVKAWRLLAKNVASSLRRGDPVIVIGRLRTSTWERDGQTYERLELDAVTVGPDLRRGQSTFHKNLKPLRPEDVDQVAEDIDPETGEIGSELDRALDQELAASGVGTGSADR
jgi:single-strand DNA-binding protein